MNTKNDLFDWYYSQDIKWRYDAIQRHYPNFTGDITEDMIKHIIHNEHNDKDNTECIHPFKRLHWVDDTVFCNECKTTLHTSNNPVLYTEDEVKALLGRVVNDSNEAYVDKFLGNTKTVEFNLRDWFTKNKK